jgi:membrane fusion protein
MEQVGETAAAQAAAVLASRAQLDRSVEELEQRAGYRLIAPVAGTVTSVTGRVGQVGAGDAPIMVILPDGALFTAELEVPSASAGFLKVGQEVKLAVDAYPHQQFGVVEGRVEQLPRSVVTRPSADGGLKTFYPVVVAIPRPFISAFGARHELRPGMTLTARIVTRRQSLLASLFEPLLTAARR